MHTEFESEKIKDIAEDIGILLQSCLFLKSSVSEGMAKENGILAGLSVAGYVISQIDNNLLVYSKY